MAKNGINTLLSLVTAGSSAAKEASVTGDFLPASDDARGVNFHAHVRLNDFPPPRYMRLDADELDVYEELILLHADDNIHRPGDAALFARLAREIRTVAKLELFIETYGPFYTTISGNGSEVEKLRPEVALLPQARVRENKYYEMLALTPVFRAAQRRKATPSKRVTKLDPSRWTR